MLRKFRIPALILAALALTACNKSAPVEAPATAAAIPPAAAPTAREAKYDADLQPGPIVWDSPEKQQAWEARRAALKANSAP